MHLTCSEETLFVWISSLLLGIITAVEMNKIVKNHKEHHRNGQNLHNLKENGAFKHPTPMTALFIAKIVSIKLVLIKSLQ